MKKQIILFLFVLITVLAEASNGITFQSAYQEIMLPPNKEIHHDNFKIEFLVGQTKSWFMFGCKNPSYNLMNIRGIYTITQLNTIRGKDYYTVVNDNGTYFTISVDKEAITLNVYGSNVLYVFYLYN